jgi:hypothetical protein
MLPVVLELTILFNSYMMIGYPFNKPSHLLEYLILEVDAIHRQDSYAVLLKEVRHGRPSQVQPIERAVQPQPSLHALGSVVCTRNHRFWYLLHSMDEELITRTQYDYTMRVDLQI